MKKIKTILLVVFFTANTLVYGQEQSSSNSIKTYDLTTLNWKLWGYRPEAWKINFNFSDFTGSWAEYINIPVEVPGSVRGALLKEGIITDWNYGLNSVLSEWVENRDWLFVTKIPDKWVSLKNKRIILHCDGLDFRGVVKINGQNAGDFNNTFLPYEFDITSLLKGKDNTLAIVFQGNPHSLGQVGYTSKIKDWKPRFYYGWDWVPRIVQTGIWDKVWLSVEDKDQPELKNILITTDADKSKDKGELRIRAYINEKYLNYKIGVSLSDVNGEKVFEDIVTGNQLVDQKVWNKLKIKRWWPNGLGDQPLYNLQITLYDKENKPVQSIRRKIGFRHLEWLPCEGAAEDAEPWICSVNGTPVFLQGVNWTPVRPNFADLKKTDYQKLLQTYKDLGINTFRVWGGSFPEKEWLYDLCDEMGIMVWQDFPLSSSGIDNYPPEGVSEVYTMSEIVKHYIYRLQYHTSLILWCGGNELYTLDNKTTVTDKHIMIREMKDVVNALDPSRRFIFGSPSGPNIGAVVSNFGSGRNWQTHGPWNLPYTAPYNEPLKEGGDIMTAVRSYWERNDALFISEAGVPGAMSAEMIEKYAGKYDPLPASIDNPLWRNVNWWIDWDEYLKDTEGKDKDSLEAYVRWSQERQKEGLAIAVKSMKDKFPRCGGFLIWMGHDCFPCMVNTSLIDFEGNLKPAAVELSKIWKDNDFISYKKK